MTRTRLLAVAGLAIAIAVIAVRPRPTPGPLLRDFEAYWAAGSTWNAHADPYGPGIWNAERGVGGVDARHEEILPFIGPPATLLVWSPFARLAYRSAALLWTALLAISLLALVVVAIRGSGVRITPFSFLAVLALALAFGPITSGLALGQLALPGFLGAALVTLVADRTLPGAIAAACLASAQPNAAVGLASQLGRNRATLAMAIGALATYVLGALAAGWAWPLAYGHAAAAHTAAEASVAIQLAPASIAYGFGAPPRPARLVGVALALLAVASAMVLALAVRDRFARFAAFSALVPFVVGFVHEHDLVVTFAAAAWCALRTRARIRAVALVGTLLVAVDWFGLAQRPTGIAQSTLLALAALGAFVALGDETDARAAPSIALACAVLFAGAAWLATRNPAPVWPDALGGFHAPVNATIAATWSAEQRASGLAAAVPAWALLRSLSLLGCALLAYAVCRQSLDVDVHHVVERRDRVGMEVL